VLEANSAPRYREGLEKELDEMRNSEMWRTGEAVRKLRPERREKPGYEKAVIGNKSQDVGK
jgi:ketol-acid reductoisomerase